MDNILLAGVDGLSVGLMIGGYKLTSEDWDKLAAGRSLEASTGDGQADGARVVAAVKRIKRPWP